jgi:EpsI family protein
MLSNPRILIVVLLFVLTSGVLHVTESVKETPIKKPLSSFPQKMGKWIRVNTNRLSNAELEMIKPSDYLNYYYASSDGDYVNLYVSYFNGVEGGYHSPRNCLPGSGWNVADITPIQLNPHTWKAGPFNVNLMIVQKGIEKQAVIYWYQNRGRIIASEYWDKVYLVVDSILKKRRDGSFVRIMAPVYNGKIEETTSSMKGFAERVVIELREFIPGAYESL